MRFPAKSSLNQGLFSNMLFLLYILFPLSFACVEHFFKKMKQIKTHLWNRLAKVQLDQLLRTDAESLKESYHYTIY